MMRRSLLLITLVCGSQSVLGQDNTWGLDEWFVPTTSEDRLLNLTDTRLAAGTDIDTIWLDGTPYGPDGITWLQSAAARGYESVVALLLERGANVTTENAWGWNALHFAAAGGSESIVRSLMLAGLSPTAPTGSERRPSSYDEPLARQVTPRQIARGYQNTDALDRLYEPVPAPSTPPPVWPLASAENDPFWNAATSATEQLHLTRDRLDAGSHHVDTLWERTPWGSGRMTWLMYACVRNREPLVDLLLQRHANVTVENGWGWTALHFAAVGGNASVTWKMLQAGSDVEQPTRGPSRQVLPIDLARQYENSGAEERLKYAVDLRRWARAAGAVGVPG